jgi:hypothetical protein
MKSQIGVALYIISGSRREVSKNCVLLGYNAAGSGNILLAFRKNISVPSSGFKNPKEILLSQCGVYIEQSVGGGSGTSVRNYH